MSDSEPIQEVPESAELLNRPERKASKLELKKQQIMQDRVQRHMANGLTLEQAIQKIQREDYDQLPIDSKLKRLEGMLVGNVQGIAKDITLLRQNQTELADVLDVNFRAFEKILAKMGIPVEDQRTILAEAEAEWKAEQKASKEEAAKKEVAANVDKAGEAAMPNGATVFGG